MHLILAEIDHYCKFFFLNNPCLKYEWTKARWDDLFHLAGSIVDYELFDMLDTQLAEDIENMEGGKPVSILAKWMPSINASPATRKLGLQFARKLQMSERTYRKTLSALRSHINVVERMMSANEWEKIEYQSVPSRAMLKYRKAFYRRDLDRFSEYIEDVKSGVKEIKAGTLYPYDLVEKYMDYDFVPADEVIEAQWKSLPDYIEGENNIVVMADVSGSMMGRPMSTSVGLAIYFAERNNGPYKDLFMTFSSEPSFVKLRGNTLSEKVHNAKNSHWKMNTDLEKAFMLVLGTAIEHGVNPEDMPKAIVAISDMEIDRCAGSRWGFYDEMELRFKSYGYEIPTIVFWNVDSRKDTFLADGNRKGVMLVSGQSVSTFKTVLGSLEGLTPYDVMLSVLNGERYSQITIP